MAVLLLMTFITIAFCLFMRWRLTALALSALVTFVSFLFAPVLGLVAGLPAVSLVGVVVLERRRASGVGGRSEGSLS